MKLSLKLNYLLTFPLNYSTFCASLLPIDLNSLNRYFYYLVSKLKVTKHE